MNDFRRCFPTGFSEGRATCVEDRVTVDTLSVHNREQCWVPKPGNGLSMVHFIPLDRLASENDKFGGCNDDNRICF